MLNRQNRSVFWLGGLVFAFVVVVAANMESQDAERIESESAEESRRAKEIQIRGGLDRRHCL